MSIYRLRCEGGVLDGLSIPPFELSDGETATLYLPPDWYIQHEQELTALFEKLSPLFEINGKVVCAEPARPPVGYFSFLKDKSISGWLRRIGEMSAEQAAAAMRRHDISVNDFRRIAGNQRLLIGMEAACAKNPDILIFSTIAVDHHGQQGAFEMARNHCARGVALYFSFPFVCQGQTGYHDFPGSMPVVISRHVPVAA